MKDKEAAPEAVSVITVGKNCQFVTFQCVKCHPLFRASFHIFQQGIEDMNIEDDKKDLISREIRSFRDAHKVGFPNNTGIQYATMYCLKLLPSVCDMCHHGVIFVKD